ncbi:DUF342 domain-containing protein [Thermoanaerobacterium sp. DL9XJH110]|uniref:DUF342 domain-containing protein n=1 Tax=Thermoanaerobacterium sp. DL9XJH110 TaxID=3386643 RepID=UPI003BB49A10
MRDLGDQNTPENLQWKIESIEKQKLQDPFKKSPGSEGKTTQMNGDNEPEDATLEIEISKDQMSATIYIIPPKGGKMITEEEILDALAKKGVTEGINREKIRQVLAQGVFFTKVEIASGVYPVAGQDGWIKYHFEAQKDLKPRVSENGRVDFYNLDLVTNVTEGQLLAEIIPPTKGISGKTVTGKIIPAKDGREVKFRTGKNVYVSEDGSKLFSSIAGQPVISEDRVSVLPILEIKGDVGPATGNINFLGSVRVKGNVKSGFKIKAEGNVEVDGTVEAAEIEAGGDIILKGGIQGRGKGLLKSNMDVFAKYIENSTVEAEQNIFVSEAVMHSNISAGKKIKIDGRKGLLVGGVSKAGEELTAKIIGSHMSTYTEVEVGINPKYKKNMLDVNDKLLSTENNLQKIIQMTQVLEKYKDKNLLPPDKKLMLAKLEQTREALQQQQQELVQQKEKLQALLTHSERARVSASDVAYAGVNIIINNASLRLRDKIEHVTFYNYQGQIKFGTYEG